MMRDWLGIEWLAFAIVWAVGAAMTKRAVRRESISSRIVHGVLFALGFFLLFRDWPWAWLNVRFLPSMEIISACAAIITGMGLAFAIWARLRLGRNWSGAVTIKRDHRLIGEAELA